MAAEIRHLKAAGGKGLQSRHPAVVQYLGHWVDDANDEIVLITELCQQDLARTVREKGPYDVDYVRYVTATTIDVLRHLHRTLQIVHRDIKVSQSINRVNSALSGVFCSLKT